MPSMFNRGILPAVFLAPRVTETGGLYGTGCKPHWPALSNKELYSVCKCKIIQDAV
jgi:hypothetical protein